MPARMAQSHPSGRLFATNSATTRLWIPSFSSTRSVRVK